ncbi:hypothetical protein BKA61DRAFT_651963 [Leptodontidium sp. MPI-SDFR-AT-0119]|nr:hypothetical protein BKA61DRAFT_651963 [Leptodontidium sp. MPI-SDFR-AT-0119]
MPWNTATSMRTSRGEQDPKQQPICVWFCHDCGDQGGMSIVIEHCPGCHHERCEHCNAEWTYSVRVDSFSLTEVSKLSGSRIRDDSSQKSAALGAVTEHAVAPNSYPIRPPKYESCMTTARPKRSCSPPILLPALSPNSACASASPSDSIETYTPQSFSCHSTATPRSHEAPPDYQYGGSGYEREDVGESKQDHDISTGDEDDEEDLSVEGYSPDSMRILESRFLSLFNHEPSNIANLLAKFQDLMQFEFGVKTATNSSAETPSSSGIGTFDQGSIESSSMTTPSYSNASSRSPNLKRGRKKDDEEQKPRRTRRKQLPERDVLHFACPFRKKNPSKYGSLTDERFSSCLAPKIPELRRIQYHLESTHRTPQCVRCYSLFNDERGLMDHQMEDPCTLKSESLKEGINPDEWSSIRALLKAKKTKSEDEKLEYEKRKWFEIFKLLFPGTSPPDNPWNELYMPASKASITVDHVLGSFERHVEEQIKNRNLERNSEVHHGIQNILASFRRYQENLATPQGSSRLDSPSEHHHTRGLEISPDTSTYQVDAEARQMSQANDIPLEPLQRPTYSYGQPMTTQDSTSYFHGEGNPQIRQSEAQMDTSDFQPPSADMPSEMVYDFEYLPNDEIFPADLNFSDYDRSFFNDPGNENHHLFLDQETPSSSLPDILVLENDDMPDSFVEQHLKTKHHGNMALRQP